jgi:hypothetical protein
VVVRLLSFGILPIHLSIRTDLRSARQQNAPFEGTLKRSILTSKMLLSLLIPCRLSVVTFSSQTSPINFHCLQMISSLSSRRMPSFRQSFPTN